MLLIGSRAICYYLPDFRQPKDWDLIANDAELEVIKTKLPANKWTNKPANGKSQQPPKKKEDKLFFRYKKDLVEVARTAKVPYWDKVYQMFADAPVLEDPILGPMRVAPLDYLLLTKQCGLVYPITHWHKNLKDVYVLRDVVESVSPEAAQLWPECVADSARMFEATHQRRQHPLACCHANARPPANTALHQKLHEKCTGQTMSMDALQNQWTHIDTLENEEKKAAMLQLLATEAQIVAVEQLLMALAGVSAPKDEQDDEPAPGSPQDLRLENVLEFGTRWLRWALRELAIGPLPVNWRYFVVNHYREIRESIPADWITFAQSEIETALLDKTAASS